MIYSWAAHSGELAVHRYRLGAPTCARPFAWKRGAGEEGSGSRAVTRGCETSAGPAGRTGGLLLTSGRQSKDRNVTQNLIWGGASHRGDTTAPTACPGLPKRPTGAMTTSEGLTRAGTHRQLCPPLSGIPVFSTGSVQPLWVPRTKLRRQTTPSSAIVILTRWKDLDTSPAIW